MVLLINTETLWYQLYWLQMLVYSATVEYVELYENLIDEISTELMEVYFNA